MNAYSPLYVEDAQENLGVMVDWACNCQGLPLALVFKLFAESALGACFGSGDPSVVAGRSGVQLGYELLQPQGLVRQDALRADAQLDCENRSPEFWTGWILAYFQWSEGITFAQLSALLCAEDVRQLYWPYHEMDILQGCDAILRLVCLAQKETNLKRVRANAGLSQADLSRLSGVSLRTIQHYEQRQKCINKASAQTVLRLCSCLCCQPADLLEPLSKQRYDYALVTLA